VQDNHASGGDFCGQITNLNFGKPVFTNSFDADLMGGWGVRPSDWGFGVSVQQEVLPRTSVEVGYHRRWLQNFTGVDNILTQSSDYTPFSIIAPADSRLPHGGGYVVSGLDDPVPSVASIFNSFSTRASNFGSQYQHFNGVLLNISSRVRNGLTVQ